MIRCFIICFAVLETVLWNLCNSADIWAIEVNQDTAQNVPYLNGHITVFKHQTDQRFFIAPLAILREETAESRYNFLNNKYEMTFYIEMFSEEAQNVVYEWLKLKYPNISTHNIELLPSEEIRLVWGKKYEDAGLNENITLASNWVSNSGLARRRPFSFSCAYAEVCDKLATLMKERPQDFSPLTLKFVLNGQKSITKKVKVTGELISEGRLWSAMVNQVGSGNDVYLNSGDVNRLTMETASNVIVQTVTEKGYMDTGDEISVTQAIEKILTERKVDTEFFNERQWQSTFWEPLFARPDKITHELNEVFKTEDGDHSNFTVNEDAIANSGGGSIGIDTPFYGFEIGGEGGHEKSKKVARNEVLNYVKGKHENVEWNGEKFVTKPMKLFRINMNNLKSSQMITATNVQVLEINDTYSKEINCNGKWETIEPHQPSVVASLKEQIKWLKETTIPNLKEKINNMKQEIGQKMTNVNHKVDNLDQTVVPELAKTIRLFKNKTLAQIEKVFETDSETKQESPNKDNFATIEGEFCLMNNNEKHECPKGFVSSKMNLYRSAKNDIQFEIDSKNIAKNVYMDYKDHRGFFYCCRQSS